MTTEKFCTKCGRKFIATGREVICPSCKAQAAEESKRAAVLKAKKASWSGESVPVRISGRASTVIRKYGEANSLPFVQALDALLKASSFFQNAGKAWESVEPYKSHRRDKHATETESTASKPQDKPQAARAAKAVNKTSTTAKTSKKASSKPSKSVKEG